MTGSSDVKSPAEIEDEERHRPATVSNPPDNPEELEKQVRREASEEEKKAPPAER